MRPRNAAVHSQLVESLLLILPAVAATAMVGCDVAEPRGPGAISVNSTATSLEPGFFQYGISIDSGSPRAALLGQPMNFVQTGLAHGKHVINVSGVPSICTGKDSREVTLRGDDTARVTFTIACGRTTGDLSVAVTTTGSDADPNGYFVRLDGLTRGFTPSNGSTKVMFVQAGNHSVTLGDVASNCSAGLPQTVAVTAGATAAVSFAVTCLRFAVLRFVATVSGSDRDPDGYVVRVGSLPATRINTASTTTVKVLPGANPWTIDDVQPNCAIPKTSGTDSLQAGDTVTIALAATCTAIPLGTVGTSIADPTADTITSSLTGPTTPHDITGISARYATGWMTLVVRFAKPVASAKDLDPQALYGYIDLDTDESATTGGAPVANYYGAAAEMGSDYYVTFFGSDSVSALLTSRSSTAVMLIGRVRTRYEGDSVLVHIPLNKLNGDDGNMAILALLGTRDRPNDIAPNTGVMAARPPAGAMMAGDDAARLHSGSARKAVMPLPAPRVLRGARW